MVHRGLSAMLLAAVLPPPPAGAELRLSEEFRGVALGRVFKEGEAR